MNQSLKCGLELHRSGKVAEAREHYRRAIAFEPMNAEIHHLLGVTFHQLGECATAIAHLDRAVELAPAASQYQSNRAETLRALGRLDEAEGAARQAVSLAPENASAHHNLGVVLFRLGRYTESESSLREALGMRPHAMTFAALGDVLRHVGRYRDAIASYESAASLAPTLVAARGNLALLYEHTGRYEDAVAHANAAVEHAPRSTAAHLHLGRLLLELGRANDAMDAFAAGLDLEPDNAELCLRNGQAWLKVGRLGEAIRWGERAWRLDPQLVEAKCLAAAAQLEAGDVETACATFQSVLDERPRCREALLGTAKALLELGDVEAAVAVLKSAAERLPEAAVFHATLGEVLMNAGDLDGAVESFRTATGYNDRCVPAYAGIGTTLRGRTDDETLGRIEALLDSPWTTNARRASLRFALAQIYDGRGDFARAGDHLAVANALQKAEFAERDRGYDPGAHRQYVTRLCEVFNRGYFRRTFGAGDRSLRPLFIVGMPRSGTTLTEQILASHPMAFGAGERRFVQASLALLPGDSGDAALDRVARLEPQQVARISAWHLAQLHRLDGGRSLRVIDKMPDNYLLLGWIVTLFPNARIIHCKRDVRDTALSCWMTNFARINWANDLGHLATRINEYHRAMDHYRRTLPTAILEVDYEETVADQAGTTRRLLDWVGLPWDEACLTYHKTERLVRTASVAQVRQPIYSRSVARWRNYESHLRPFLGFLDSLP